MNPPFVPFSPEELACLRDHGVVLFADRVIFDAQAPMNGDRIAEIQSLCAGPLPPDLLALWSLTAGGRLDYDLSLPIDGNMQPMSWAELFWDGSDGYRDLEGWIEHEQELAEEAASEAGLTWDGRLTHLPFGGFEYLERIYAVVEPGSAHGSIVAWRQGLPPAWTFQQHEDAACTVALNLRAAFAALHLVEDPSAPVSDYFTGQSLIDYLEQRCETHGLERRPGLPSSRLGRLASRADGRYLAPRSGRHPRGIAPLRGHR